MADVPSPEGSPSRLRRDPSFSLGGNIDAFYKGASAAIAAAFVLTLVVLSERSSGWQVRFLFASVVTGGLMVVLFAFSLFTGAKRSVDTLLHLLVNWYVLTIAVTYWPSRLPKLSSAGGGWGSATAELMKPDMARE